MMRTAQIRLVSHTRTIAVTLHSGSLFLLPRRGGWPLLLRLVCGIIVATGHHPRWVHLRNVVMLLHVSLMMTLHWVEVVVVFVPVTILLMADDIAAGCSNLRCGCISVDLRSLLRTALDDVRTMVTEAYRAVVLQIINAESRSCVWAIKSEIIEVL